MLSVIDLLYFFSFILVLIREKNCFSLCFSRTPEILWAQRSDKIYLTVSLPDAKDIVVKCEPEGLFKFSASGPQGEKYECTLELYGAVASEVCFPYFF